MKAVVWKSTDRIIVEDIPEPAKISSETLVRVRYAGICGSDLTIVSGKHPRAKAPLVLGHEFVGIVESLPDGYEGPIAEGDRVAVNPLISCKRCPQCLKGKEHICENLQLLGIEHGPGAFTSIVSVPQVERLFPVPPEVTDREAALTEPLAVAVHAVECAGIKPYETAVILGAGPIGLLIAQTVRAYGVSSILLCEVAEERLNMAKTLGFTAVDTSDGKGIEKVLAETNGRGGDVTFEAAGVPVTAEMAIPVTGINGKIIMTALHKKNAEVLFRDLAYGEQKIIGTRIYATDDFGKALYLMEQKKVDVGPLITNVFGIDDADRAFEAARTDRSACKILIEPKYIRRYK